MERHKNLNAGMILRNENEDQTKKVFEEGEHSQRHPEESKLNWASRLNLGVRKEEGCAREEEKTEEAKWLSYIRIRKAGARTVKFRG